MFWAGLYMRLALGLAPLSEYPGNVSPFALLLTMWNQS